MSVKKILDIGYRIAYSVGLTVLCVWTMGKNKKPRKPRSKNTPF